MEWIGIDYGSKLAGTTVICFKGDDNELHFINSKKNQDADNMISEFLRDNQPKYVFIDAPLSLPKAYFGEGNDFFYREGDRAIGAMSPMFLGGLTARAMKLKSQFDKKIEFFEAYPGGLAKELKLKELNYKKGKEYIPTIIDLLLAKFEIKLAETPNNWHQVDALLAYLIGWRHKNNSANFFGEKTEGGIWV